MPNTHEQRRGPDRRRLPRGGRRSTDRPGYAPLVLVVDDEAESATRSETILSKLRFAVAPARSVDEALRIITTLHPDLIVAREGDAARMRREVPENVPVVAVPDGEPAAEVLIEDIRRALRGRKPRSSDGRGETGGA